MKILIVEDQVGNLIVRFLEHGLTGVSVRLATNLADGLTAFDELDPDVLIVDGSFPDAPTGDERLNGPRFIEAVRAKGFRGTVIGIPGGSHSTSAITAAGCDQVFEKPHVSGVVGYIAQLVSVPAEVED